MQDPQGTSSCDGLHAALRMWQHTMPVVQMVVLAAQLHNAKSDLGRIHR